MKATEETILDFIGGYKKVFIIPPFQRNYEWTSKQCKELFDDIVNAYNTDKNHYLGNVVYYIGKNTNAGFSEFILVDGQQRVTTILLLLCAIRDLTIDEAIKADINELYLKNNRTDEAYRVRLKQTSYDEQSFISVIDTTDITDYKDSNVVKNYQYFIKLLKESNVELESIYNSLQKLQIVDVNLQIDNDLSAVQTVFEKINSTGKPLESADLIRNYLLLANSSHQQESLYKQYWIKIEQTVKNENISKFARDYLIMKIFDEVSEENTYKTFKDSFKKIEKTDILADLSKFSQYYKWLLFEDSSPNKELNKTLCYLNMLNTKDLYPLYLYLFNELFYSNIDELNKILNLLSDFMLRYRIVKPSGGGGALRMVIYQLLQKMNENEIDINYDSILYELSNSNTPAGRFPDDHDFEKALMESSNYNYKYARVLFSKMENFETKNIHVPIKDITIEHLMPQNLSSKWKNYLGGEEIAIKIHETYLNCIGNLAPMSIGYNAKNSNRPWDKKLEEINNVQFKITSEIAKSYKDWKEKNMQERNKNIAKRACKAIISPLVQTRRYQTNSVSEEFLPGLYPISDITTPMSGKHITAIVYDKSATYNIDSWKDFLQTICEIAFDLDNNLLRKIARENYIHKATSTKKIPDKDPIIATDSNLLNDAKPIKNSGLYVEGNISSDRARFYAKQLLDLYELSDDFQIQVEN